MRTSVAQTLAALVALLLGCGNIRGEGGEGDTGGGPQASLLAEIDTNHFCDMVGVVDVVLRATPTSGAAIEGTVFSCPAVDPTALLGVDLGEAGTYRLAAVASFTTGEQAPECFTTEDGSETFTLTDAQIDAADQIIVESDHAPCPGN